MNFEKNLKGIKCPRKEDKQKIGLGIQIWPKCAGDPMEINQFAQVVSLL